MKYLKVYFIIFQKIGRFEMNKVISSIAACALIAGSQFAATGAYAQSIDGTYTGTVDVFKGIALTCAASVTFSGGGTTAVLSIAPGSPNCAALHINSNPHSVSGGAIQNVDVTTITLGDCFGNMPYTWDNANTIVVDATLPPKTGGAACTVAGELVRS